MKEPVDTLDHDFPSAGEDKLIPHAQQLLLLCDGGGSNARNRHVFKKALQKLADLLDLEIRVAHYPPYCSKYNPIEHRLFSHITHTCQGSGIPFGHHRQTFHGESQNLYRLKINR